MQNNLYNENIFNKIMTRLFDMICIGVLTVLCSLPLITLGASVSSMYRVMLKMVNDEDSENVKTFFQFFRNNIKQTIPYSFLYVFALVILSADLNIFRTRTGIAQVFYGICLAVIFALTAVYAYIFPLLSAFDNTLRGTLNNAWRLALIHWQKTILLVLIHTAPFFWFYFSPDTFAPVFWPLALIYPGLSGFLSSMILNSTIDKLKETAE